MCAEVSIPVSGRYNSLYDERDLHHALIALSLSNGYAESGMRRLAIESASASASTSTAADARVPSGSWVRDRVASIGEGEMTSMLNRALDSTLEQVKSFGVFASPIIAAIDIHDIYRYDHDLDGGFLRRGKRERGTTKRESYATLQCVEEGRRAQIACEQFGFFDEKNEVVERLLTTARLDEMEISLLLLDRGFFSSPVINVLERNGQIFLMPCILYDGVKKALIEYAQGRRKRISRYEMGPEESRVSFTLVILPKRNVSTEEKNPLKRFIPFATNMPRDRILWNVWRLPADYRMRWGIESGYSGVEQFRAKTTSRNHSLRLLYLFYSMILYNAWLIANLVLARRFAKVLGRPIITTQIVKA
ncbi:MAG: hypothetical protein HYY22_11135, partial [Thaumarchaeota archaeon]|nr:hypothetical protein [Nitrososphaerota archaeon]